MVYNLIFALVVFTTIDFITCIIRGVQEKTLSSNRGRDFILKKIMIFLLIAATYILEAFVLREDTGNTITTTVISFYILNEGIGILENATALGLPVPGILKEVFSNKK